MKNYNIGVFVDIISLHKNIRRNFQSNSKLDYKTYLNRIREEGDIYKMFAYGSQLNYEATKFISFLKLTGFYTKYIEPKKNIVYPYQLLETVERVFELEENNSIISSLEEKIKDENKPNVSYNINQTDPSIEIIVDILRVLPRIDIVVIGSSNPKLLPFIKFLKEKGIRIIVFSSSIPYSIRGEVDTWIEIDESYLEKEEVYEVSRATD